MRIGITGGIAEGKSTVLRMLEEMGYAVESSDRIAREVFNDPEFNHRLAEIAGLPAPIAPADLRHAMNESRTVRRRVNRLMHPEVGRRSRESRAQFFEVPLLIEACLRESYDAVWVVTCGRVQQRERLRARYGDSADLDAILATQLPTEVKIAFADEVIRTDQPPDRVISTLSEAANRALG